MADNQKEKKSSSVLGNRLRTMRDLADMSQSAVAKEIGLNTMSILNYETGKRVPDAEALRKFAQLYGCTADYLLGLSEYANLEEEKKSEKIESDFYNEIESLPLNTKIFLMEDLSRFIADTKAYAPDESAHFGIIQEFCHLMYTQRELVNVLRQMREPINTQENNQQPTRKETTEDLIKVMKHLRTTRNRNDDLNISLLHLINRNETS